ncbi:hypothetical protein GGR56DRAFT_191037 [Xylariaceae sp. FL0804]|nr:hypothetical protein GGR56DRAFT_191037 [Xylariaceae sp. FL0804]
MNQRRRLARPLFETKADGSQRLLPSSHYGSEASVELRQDPIQSGSSDVDSSTSSPVPAHSSSHSQSVDEPPTSQDNTQKTIPVPKGTVRSSQLHRPFTRGRARVTTMSGDGNNSTPPESSDKEAQTTLRESAHPVPRLIMESESPENPETGQDLNDNLAQDDSDQAGDSDNYDGDNGDDSDGEYRLHESDASGSETTITMELKGTRARKNTRRTAKGMESKPKFATRSSGARKTKQAKASGSRARVSARKEVPTTSVKGGPEVPTPNTAGHRPNTRIQRRALPTPKQRHNTDDIHIDGSPEIPDSYQEIPDSQAQGQKIAPIPGKRIAKKGYFDKQKEPAGIGEGSLAGKHSEAIQGSSLNQDETTSVAKNTAARNRRKVAKPANPAKRTSDNTLLTPLTLPQVRDSVPSADGLLPTDAMEELDPWEPPSSPLMAPVKKFGALRERQPISTKLAAPPEQSSSSNSKEGRKSAKHERPPKKTRSARTIDIDADPRPSSGTAADSAVTGRAYEQPPEQASENQATSDITTFPYADKWTQRDGSVVSCFDPQPQAPENPKVEIFDGLRPEASSMKAVAEADEHPTVISSENGIDLASPEEHLTDENANFSAPLCPISSPGTTPLAQPQDAAVSTSPTAGNKQSRKTQFFLRKSETSSKGPMEPESRKRDRGIEVGETTHQRTKQLRIDQASFEHEATSRTWKGQTNHAATHSGDQYAELVGTLRSDLQSPPLLVTPLGSSQPAIRSPPDFKARFRAVGHIDNRIDSANPSMGNTHTPRSLEAIDSRINDSFAPHPNPHIVPKANPSRGVLEGTRETRIFEGKQRPRSPRDSAEGPQRKYADSQAKDRFSALFNKNSSLTKDSDASRRAPASRFSGLNESPARFCGDGSEAAIMRTDSTDIWETSVRSARGDVTDLLHQCTMVTTQLLTSLPCIC